MYWKKVLEEITSFKMVYQWIFFNWQYPKYEFFKMIKNKIFKNFLIPIIVWVPETSDPMYDPLWNLKWKLLNGWKIFIPKMKKKDDISFVFLRLKIWLNITFLFDLVRKEDINQRSRYTH